MFPMPTVQVSDEADSTPPAEQKTPELPPQILAPPNDTPIKRTCATMQPFTTNTRCRDTTLNAMGNEIRGYLVGPMPAEEFLEEFLSPTTIPDYQPLTSFSEGAFTSTVSAALETEAYNPFVSASTMRRSLSA